MNGVFASSQIKGVSLGDYSSGCDYYLIEDSTGSYTLAEWYGGVSPDRGDIVVGDLHSYGFKDLYDITNGLSTRVWLDDWLLSRNRAAEKLTDKCGWKGNMADYMSYSGYYSYSDYSSAIFTPSPTPIPISCPAHSYLNGDKCTCIIGYIADSTKTYCILAPTPTPTPTPLSCTYGFLPRDGRCISNTEDCINNFGSNVSGVPGDNNNSSCNCNSGYQWNQSKTACIQLVQPTSQLNPLITPKIISSESKIKNSPSPTNIEKLLINIEDQQEDKTTTSSQILKTNFFQRLWEKIKSWF